MKTEILSRVSFLLDGALVEQTIMRIGLRLGLSLDVYLVLRPMESHLTSRQRDYIRPCLQ